MRAARQQPQAVGRLLFGLGLGQIAPAEPDHGIAGEDVNERPQRLDLRRMQ